MPNKLIASSSLSLELKKRPLTLGVLQRYVYKACKLRGFDKETSHEILALLIEEIGELSKALRKYSGVKIDKNKSPKHLNLEEEFADVLFVLFSLANSCNVNLNEAFLKKEKQNNKRTWSH